MKPTPLLGKLYLIPTTLGESEPMDVLPQTVKRAVEFIDDYIVENEKTARKFIKSIVPEKVQASLRLSALNKHTLVSEHSDMIKACFEGRNVGLMSEAGCPGVADPGAVIRQADVIVTATGVPGLIKTEDVKIGAVVVDAGTAAEHGKIVGDVSDDIRERDDVIITPLKGGVGPLTVTALFDNVIQAAQATKSQES